MRVVLHPADEHGCGSYRMIWPGQALKAQGYDVSVDLDYSYRGVWRRTIRGEVLVNLDQVVRADVVVIQRPLHRNRFELIQILQSKGVAVVVEVDDDFHAIHKRNAAWRGTNLLHHPDHHRDWLKKSCEIADLVTVTTPALAQRYGAHGRVAVLPNCVPERYLYLSDAWASVPEWLNGELAKADGVGSQEPVSPHSLKGSNPFTGPIVGWSGSVQTHPGDLEVTGGALRDFQISVVGTGKGVRKALGLNYEPRSTGWLRIEDYPRALAQLDVGIVPLNPGPFNEAKSALKGLEFAAVGVPFVASPTGPYRDLHHQGAGLLADSPAEWKAQVQRLVYDRGYRAEVRSVGLETAKRSTVEENCWRWYQAYQWAVMQRRQAA